MACSAQFEPREKTESTLSKVTEKDQAGLSTIVRIRWTIRFFAVLLRIGIEHPSVVWHYLAGNFRFILIKLGLLSGLAKHVAEVHEEFEARAEQGRFKERWFDANVVPWCVMFSRVFDRADPVRILEIGSWEGRSTLFLLTYFTQGQLTAVDTWAGSDEYHYNATGSLGDLEGRFDGNTAPGVERLTKRKGSSLHVLPRLLDEDQKFDVIYVDGSHIADDVLTDGITAWRLLKQGGVMIFDDFLWPCYPRARANPWWAINLFLKYHKGEYKILDVNYQLTLEKTRTFTDHADVPL
jgi:predicted O-methyltransferase YrrM